MRKFFVTLLVALSVTLFTGCSTLSPQVQKSPESVQLAGIEHDNSLAGSTIDQIGEGLASDVLAEEIPLVVNGVTQFDGNGEVIYIKRRRSRTQARSDMSFLSGAEERSFGMGRFSDGELEGIRYDTRREEGGTARNPEVITARYAGLAQSLAAEYQGRGDLVKARSDGLVSLITVAGEQIVGRIVAPWERTATGVIKAVVQRDGAEEPETVYLPAPTVAQPTE